VASLEVFEVDDGPVRGFFPPADPDVFLSQGVWVTWVTGAWFSGDGILGAGFQPGRPLTLVFDPKRRDRPVVEVWDLDRVDRAGWIARPTIPDVSPARHSVLSLLEYVEDQRRTALLIAVSLETVELVRSATLDTAHNRSLLRERIKHRPTRPSRYSHPRPVPPREAVRRVGRMLRGQRMFEG
jgi:hypothetical protein